MKGNGWDLHFLTVGLFKTLWALGSQMYRCELNMHLVHHNSHPLPEYVK